MKFAHIISNLFHLLTVSGLFFLDADITTCKEAADEAEEDSVGFAEFSYFVPVHFYCRLVVNYIVMKYVFSTEIYFYKAESILILILKILSRVDQQMFCCRD